MLRIFSIFILFCLTSGGEIYGQGKLIPYRKADRWGFSDAGKKVVIKPVYKNVNFFEGDLAIVECDSGSLVIDKTGKQISSVYKYAYLRDKGNFYLGCKDYGSCELFKTNGEKIMDFGEMGFFNTEGLSSVQQGYYKFGVVNLEGKLLVPAQYMKVELMPGKMVIVMNDKYEYGFYNLLEGITVPCAYEKIYSFSEGLALASKSKKWGFIDARGNEAIPFVYDRVPWQNYFGEQNFFNFNYDGFSEGLAVVMKDGQAGFIDRKGEVVVPFNYDLAYGFKKGLAWVMKGEKWGMINQKGEVVIKIELDTYSAMSDKELEALDGVSEGMITLRKDDKCGFADVTGKIVIPFRYQSASSFRNGLAGVMINEKWGMINKKGIMVIPAIYETFAGLFSYQYENPFDRGYALALLTGKGYALIDKTGKKLINHYFDDDVYFTGDYTSTVIKNKTTVINTKGVIVYTLPDNVDISIYENGLIRDYKRDCYIDVKKKISYCD